MLPLKSPIRGVAVMSIHLIGTFWGIFLFILSLKVLPFAWHVRNTYIFLTRYVFDKRPLPPETPANITLFQPTIITSSTPLGEIDVMGHKSNSTYFTDFDAARNYHLLSLFRVGLRAWSERGPSWINTHKRREDGSEPFYFAIGGVACTFRRGIKPRQKYDIVTQVLSWDEKWIYFISHFVEKGSFKPVHFSDQPHRNRRQDGTNLAFPQPQAHTPSADSTVLAISVGKMVFKKGRKTIRPVDFLRDCGLLPLESGISSASTTSSEKSDSTAEDKDRGRRATEDRRIRGLRIAQGLNILDEGLDLFDPEASTAYAQM